MRIGHHVTHVVSCDCEGAIKDCTSLSHWSTTLTCWESGEVSHPYESVMRAARSRPTKLVRVAG